MSDTAVKKESFFRRASGKVFIIWFVMSAAGVLIGLYAPGALMPSMLSVQGHQAVLTTVLFTVLAAPVAALIYGIAFYSIWAWRHKGGTDKSTPPPDGPPLRGNTVVAYAWLTISSVLVIALLAWGLTLNAAGSDVEPNTLTINVTGQQWLWTFNYPGENVSSHVLELPVDRTIRFDVTSEDVTHGFWLASLGVQVDANPGEITTIQTTTNKTGHFTLRCSQLCGLYHSFMYAQVYVVPEAQFAKWLEAQGATSAAADQAALMA